MGSIAAIVTSGGEPPSERLRRALVAAPHRGDDVVTRTSGRVGVGVSRPSSAEAPPAAHAGIGSAGGYMVAYTGVLDDLGQPRGHGPDGTTADAVATALAERFARGVTRMIPGLRGIYSMCVTDGTRLWAFRDHVGFKPLFYRAQDGVVICATEAKQVAAGAGLRRTPDLDVVEQIFYGTYDDDTPCALRGVRRLPKATTLVSDGRVTTTARYWHPEQVLETAPRLHPRDLQDGFDTVFSQAVDRCLTGGDVVSLSGGIDSTVIAGYAAPVHLERFGRPLPALSVLYPEQPAVDERAYIEMVVEHCGLRLHTLNNDASSIGDIEQWVQLMDGPVPTVAIGEMQSFYGRARQLGYCSVLGGEIAEFVIDMADGVIPHLVATGRLGDVLRRTRALRARGMHPVRLARAVGAAAVPRAVAKARARRTKGRMVPDFLDARRVAAGYASSTPAPRHRWRQRQAAAFNGPGLSVEAEEIVHTACGVQVRRPWIDVDVWEFFLSLRADQKHPPGGPRKRLVRHLARGRVPDEILDRTDKTVFNDALLAAVDYPQLQRWTEGGDFRMPGVDYGRLRQRLSARDLDLYDYVWAKDLAVAHAYVESAPRASEAA